MAKLLLAMDELLLAMAEFGKQLHAFSCQIVGAERRSSRPRLPDSMPGAGSVAAAFGRKRWHGNGV
jgi:hypothetical protein